MTGLDEENLIRRFLLGRLSPDERERVGERLFADEDFFAQVDAVEEELIDDFARGRLGAVDHEQFERQFLITDERRERLRFARDFHQVLSGSYPPLTTEAAVNPDDVEYSGVWAWLRRRRALAFGFAFSLLLVGSILLWQVLSRRSSQEQAAATQEQRTPTPQNENVHTAGNSNQDKDIPRDQAPGETAQPHIASNTQANEATRLAENQRRNRRSASSFFAVTLEAGNLRSESDFKKISVPKGARTALLKLHFDDDEGGTARQGATYEVELQNGEIKTIHQAKNLHSSTARGGGRFVTVSVPARLLEIGNYHVVLQKRSLDEKVEGVGSYYFSVAEAYRHKGGN